MIIVRYRQESKKKRIYLMESLYCAAALEKQKCYKLVLFT